MTTHRFVAGLLLALAATAAHAQQPPAAAIRGIVVDSAGRPIEDAEVGVAALGAVRTDTAGRFALPPLAYAFPVTLNVRRVGFEPRAVALAAPDTALRLVLRATGQVLETVRVLDDRPPTLVANGFYDRKRKQTGRLLDSLALRQFASTGLVGVLRETNRVQLRRLGTDDYAYTTTAGKQCRMNVFVDGHYEYASQPGGTGGFNMEGVGLRELLPFDAILAIEIYPSVHSVPSQFQRAGLAAQAQRRRPGDSGNAACGAIVIWTKRVEASAP